MEENEIREALRTVLTQSPEPPPMESATAVAAGKRAARRRTVLACAGTVAALAAVTVIPVRYLSAGDGPDTGFEVAAPAASATPSRHAQPSANGSPDPAESKPSWPAEASGDATADSGPHYQNGRKLLDALLTMVPDGYQTPTGTLPDGTERQSHQAAIEENGWSYLASVTIAKAGGAGQLLAEVHEKGNKLPTGPCELAESFWDISGVTCTVTKVGSAEVGVATSTGADRRLDQWAAYRFPDGVVAFVAQTRAASFAAETPGPKLASLPFTATELAGLATQQRLRVAG